MKIIGICGSLRTASFNRKVLQYCLEHGKKLGHQTQEIDLAKISLPIFNEDLEADFPEQALLAKKQIEDSDLVVIVSPEYNHSLPGGLKNFIDWMTRGEKNSWDKKTAVIMGFSNGVYGTVRMQRHLREVLAAVNVIVLPQPQVLIGQVEGNFDESGNFINEKMKNKIKQLIDQSLLNVK